MILEQFAKERKYDINILTKNGWYVEDGKIKIKHTDEYIVTRESIGKTIKPKDKKAKPYFISGSSDKIVIVEGQTDAIAVKHINPELNVFAIGGTGSYKLLSMIKYYYQGNKIILAYDQDDAGRICTNYSIDLLINLNKNYDIRVLKWNEKLKDIDEYYRKYGMNEKLLKLDLFKIKGKKIIYDGDFIEELKLLTDQKIQIGKKIKCINPEHNDNTPSMHIYKDHAYCFSCGFHIKPQKIEKKKKKKEDSFSEAIGFFTDFKEMGERFVKIQPLFYDKSGIWWLWNFELFKYDMIDDVDIMNKIDDALPTIDTINSKTKNEIIESLKRVGRKHIPKDAPTKWIQFKDKAYSINSDNVYEVKPNYFFTNPIPWELGNSEETPIFDKLFKEWVGEEYVQTLYEIIAYCCYRDYPIQLLFCLYGNGRNGKSTFLKILSKFIGKENLCSTELDLLMGSSSSRFESFKLYKKSCCLMGETNFGLLDKSSMLKKLTGGDMIGFEMKGKKPFDDYSYAKMLIASNSLPTSQDTSEGFYRRWLIIDFPNQFPEGKDITLDIPDSEYQNLSLKCCKILRKLIECGQFTNQGNINDRKLKYIMASNPLPMFLKERCKKSQDGYVSYNELYTAYMLYLNKHKKRKVSRKEFKSSLEDEGFWIERTSKKVGEEYISGLWIDGLSIDPNYVNYVNYATIPTRNPIGGNELESTTQITQFTQNTHHKCYICGDSPTTGYDYGNMGKPICEKCRQKPFVKEEYIQDT